MPFSCRWLAPALHTQTFFVAMVLFLSLRFRAKTARSISLKSFFTFHNFITVPLQNGADRVSLPHAELQAEPAAGLQGPVHRGRQWTR